MKTSPFDHYWNDPSNWKWRLFYSCKDDPRVIVPKKPKWAGRTLNFAHARSFLVLLLTVVAIIIPAILCTVFSAVWSTIAFLAVIAGIVVFYYTVELQVKTNG